METPGAKCVAIFAALITMTGWACAADEPQLQLNERSLTVYPIVLARPDKAITKDTQEFGERIAEVVGYELEQYGMRPGVSAAYPEKIVPADDLAEVERKLQAFVKGEASGTDYALFAFFGIRPSKRGPAVARICAILTDTAGRSVWAKNITEIPEGRMSSPLGACMMLAGQIRSISDLEEPDPDNTPYGPMARLMDQRNGLPPKPERDAMGKRFKAAYESFGDATLSIYPFRIWKREEGSVEGAEALARKLTEAGQFKASAVKTDTRLVATRDPDQPSQMRILWNTARDFRSYLRKHPDGADYALLVDVTIPTHHVHIVLCEGSGEWMTVSLMNSHHPEFQEVDPKTLEDCVELAFRRLKATVQGQREQEKLAEAVAAYKPDPRHAGTYTGKEGPSLNYIELKPDGSAHVKDDGHEMKCTFAVVEGNRLVLTLPGRGSRPVGTFEDGKLTMRDGEELTRTNCPVPGRAWIVPELGIELAYIQEGPFHMGSENVRSRAYPVHQVRITRAFWMGRYEVTQKEYKTLIETNPSRHKGETSPVESVSWYDAVAFCKTLTDRERDAGRLPEGYEYRLPSEAEWEYAARGGAKGGDTKDSAPDPKQQLRWHLKTFRDKPHPVGAGEKNALGLYGMSGNVWEWCLDWYDEAGYGKSPATDPVGPTTGKERICRGGLQPYLFDGYSPAAYRDPDPPANTDDFLGFRVVLGASLRSKDQD